METNEAAPPAGAEGKLRNSADEEQGQGADEGEAKVAGSHHQVAEKLRHEIAGLMDQLQLLTKKVHALRNGATGDPSEVAQPSEPQGTEITAPLETAQEFEWEESIWVASVFAGAPGIEIGASIVTLFLLVTTIVVQGAFSIVSYTNFIEAPFTEENYESAKQFRYSLGHHVNFQDTLTLASLTRRVCDGGVALDMGTRSSTLVKDIESYLGTNVDEDFPLQEHFAGRVMCILAVVCWTLVVMEEWSATFDLGRSCLLIAWRNKCSLRRLEDDSIVVEAIAYHRIILLMLILVARLGISLHLFWTGCLWLAYTLNLETLLLNAVALGFVLDIDNLLFDVAPGQVKTLMSKLQPITLPATPSRWGADVSSVGKIIICISIVVFLDIVVLGPQEEDMRKTMDMLCGGNKDFVFTQDGFGIPYISPAKVREQDAPHIRHAGGAIQEVLDATNATLDVNWRTEVAFNVSLIADSFRPHEISPTAAVQKMDQSQVIDMLNPLCSNNLWDAIHQIKLSFVTIDANKTTAAMQRDNTLNCESMSHYFASPDWRGMYIRFVCPISAGCGGVLTHVPSLDTSRGCPSGCTRVRSEEQAQMPCEDQPLETVLNSSWWPSWVDFAHRNGMFATDRDAMRTRLLTGGCEALNTIEEVSLPVFSKVGMCLGTELTVHPFAGACPVTCGCNTRFKPGAAQVCPAVCLNEMFDSVPK